VAHFLLLHGACHGGWCWDDVVEILDGSGHSAAAPDLPCDDLDSGLDEYADAAVAALRDQPANLVIVAHSLGALVAPLVASRVPARRIVYVAGIIGMPGRSLEQLAEIDADRDGPLGDDDLDFDAQGRFRFSATGARRLLYQDCPDDVADAAIERLRFQRSMWSQVARFDEWPNAETVSIVCADDRVVNRGWSERIARERLGVEPVVIEGGHSPFLSRPAELVAALTAGV
jgi:pimeloyl-ACP methyl ester carboxylesterase